MWLSCVCCSSRPPPCPTNWSTVSTINDWEGNYWPHSIHLHSHALNDLISSGLISSDLLVPLELWYGLWNTPSYSFLALCVCCFSLSMLSLSDWQILVTNFSLAQAVCMVFQGCTCLTSRLTFSCCHSYWKSFYIDDQYEASLTCLIHPIGIKWAE